MGWVHALLLALGVVFFFAYLIGLATDHWWMVLAAAVGLMLIAAAFGFSAVKFSQPKYMVECVITVMVACSALVDTRLMK